MKVKLTKRYSMSLRTPSIIGELHSVWPPEIGSPIVITNNEPLTGGPGMRCVQTSPVVKVKIDDGDTVTVNTENSVYTLERINNHA